MTQRPRVWYNKESRMIDIISITYDRVGRTNDVESIFYQTCTIENVKISFFTNTITDKEDIKSLVFMNFLYVDNNGYSIYEGDILTGKYRNECWHGNVIGVVNPGLYEGSRTITFGNNRIVKIDESFKLIGNIYENPELLSGSII